MRPIGGLLCHKLIDGTGGEPKRNVLVSIGNGIISDVSERFTALSVDGQIVDARELTVLPGLMDLHVHLSVGLIDPTEPHALLAILNSPVPLLAFHAAKNARLLLEAGFTTVRDFGDMIDMRNTAVVSLRRAIHIGLMTGPRIFAAGWVSSTAGHRDMFPPPSFRRNPADVADGVDEVRKLVRSLIRDGVDLLKTSSAGGLAGYGEEIWWRNYTVDELAAIADEAHAVGKRMAVHTYMAFGVKNALRAGADTIEHGTELDDEAIELLLDRGAFLVPTLMVRSDLGLAGSQRAGAHEHLMRKHREAHLHGEAGFQKAYGAGVKIATGTDIGLSLREHMGDSAYELELMVEYGMSPMDAIAASTRVAAEALGMEEKLGTVESGKIADLVIFDGDPLVDIHSLQDKPRIVGVVKDGQLEVDRGVKFLDPEEARMIGNS